MTADTVIDLDHKNVFNVPAKTEDTKKPIIRIGEVIKADGRRVKVEEHVKITEELSKKRPKKPAIKTAKKETQLEQRLWSIAW